MEIFKDKTAIITGGGSGIGRELGKQLAGKGAIVILADINAGAAEEVAGSIRKAGHQARAAGLDVMDRAALKKLVDGVAGEFGKLDYIFNNAGIGVAGEVRDYSFEDWKNVIDMNIYGVISGVDAAYPLMIRQGFGHIVNTSSIAGLIPFPMETSYCAAKHAIVGLSNSLRVEAEKLGVNVSVVCPGLIDTPIWKTNKTVKLDRDKALAGLPMKLTSTKKCVREIIAGVEKNKAIIVTTATARSLWLLYRLSPGLMLRVLKKQIDKSREARIE